MDFYPYKNTVRMNEIRSLTWSNGTILEAVYFYKVIFEVDITADALLAELQSKKLRAIQALLFGAIKVSNPEFTTDMFAKIYKPENLSEYVAVVLNGMVHYYPEPEIKDRGEDLDESYPDTQKEVKKKRQGRTGGSGSGFVKK